MAESAAEKTEAATPKRRQESRDQGNVARSTDLSAAFILLMSIVLLYVFGFKVMLGIKQVVQSMLANSSAGNPTLPGDVNSLGIFGLRLMLEMVAPLCLGITAAGLLVSVGQVGLIFTFKPLQPDLSKVSPLQGMKKLFDARAGMRLIMSLGKVGLVILVATVLIYQDMPGITMLAELEALPLFACVCELVFSLALKLAFMLLVLALLDYWFQKWQHERDMRMTKQEVKEELKTMEGDPLVKQRRARVARQLALQRIGQAVPNADVVVTNPTHFSIAMRYDSKTMKAPKVVAKGADFLAMRIRQIAIANGVPMVERKELAQALYKTVEVGQEVPPQFYTAVAEILAYVFRLSGRKSA